LKCQIDNQGFMTPKQQEAIVKAANNWVASKVPYVFGGDTKSGADCSGSVSAIYAQAGINIGRMSSGGFAISKLFRKVTGAPEVGDVGWFPGHVAIYSGNTIAKNNVWSVFHTGGPVFGPANSAWFGTPTWYRYIGP
jgi:cell wall-associated NlpC family hydrolase